MYCITKFISDKFRRILQEELSFFSKDIMTTIDDVTAQVTALNTSVADVSTKLDTIQALVTQLESGSVTQAQIDALSAAVTTAQDSVTAISGKEDRIK